MRKFIGAALVACFLAGVAVAQSGTPSGRTTPAATKLVPFTSASGGFTVLAPDGMTEMEIPAPPFRAVYFIGKDDFLVYRIRATFLPEGGRPVDSASERFNENDKKTAKDMKADIVLKKDFELDGFPARETHFLSKDKTKLLVRRAIRAESRQFALSVEGTPDQANRPEIRAFLDSFKLN